MWKLHIIDKILCETSNRLPEQTGFGFAGEITAAVVMYASRKVL